jgi:hypothetical protein
MKEKPVSTKPDQNRGESPRPKEKREDSARPETRKRVRKIVERHRETFDELSK